MAKQRKSKEKDVDVSAASSLSTYQPGSLLQFLSQQTGQSKTVPVVDIFGDTNQKKATQKPKKVEISQPEESSSDDYDEDENEDEEEVLKLRYLANNEDWLADVDHSGEEDEEDGEEDDEDGEEGEDGEDNGEEDAEQNEDDEDEEENDEEEDGEEEEEDDEEEGAEEEEGDSSDEEARKGMKRPRREMRDEEDNRSSKRSKQSTALAPPVVRPVREVPTFDASRTIYIGNLSFQVNEDALKTAFEKCGKIDNVYLEKNNSGRPSGFGYVQFANASLASKAIQMSGQELLGRLMRISHYEKDQMYKREGARKEKKQKKKMLRHEAKRDAGSNSQSKKKGFFKAFNKGSKRGKY